MEIMWAEEAKRKDSQDERRKKVEEHLWGPRMNGGKISGEEEGGWSRENRN